MTIEELTAQLNALKQENAQLVAKATQRKAKGAAIRVSAKGAISVYGLGRFPVTLYDTQWTKLFEMVEDVKTFIQDNKHLLAKRGDAE